MKMRKLLFVILLACVISSCGDSESSGNSEDEYGYPDCIEQVVTRYCTTCGGSGQVMTAYGVANCPSCVAYGRPSSYKETVLVSSPNGHGGSSHPSFQAGRSDVKVEVRNVDCDGYGGSLCSCTTYKGYKTAGTNNYHGACQNYVAGHKCGHSPSDHGL